MIAARRRVIRKHIHGDGIGDHIDLNIVMIPVPTLRPAFFIYMAEYHDAFGVSNRCFALKEVPERRVQDAPNIGGGAPLLFGEQQRQPDAEPPFDGKARFYWNRLCCNRIHILQCPRISRVGGKRSGQQRQFFTFLGQLQRHGIRQLHAFPSGQTAEIFYGHAEPSILRLYFIQQMNERAYRVHRLQPPLCKM